MEAFHGAEAAEGAAAEFRRRFSEGALPTEIEEKTEEAGEQLLAVLLSRIDFAASNSEARRLISQGGVRVEQRKVDDPQAKVTVQPGSTLLIQVGKRRVCKVTAA